MIPYNDFPLLVPGNHRVTSPVDYKYNCIAWAAGDTHRWWQPGKPYYWPVAGWPKNDAGLGGLVKAFASLGYVDCDMDATLNLGWEKLAIYGTSQLWTHAARQLPTGLWTSKLGEGVDIEHDTPESVSQGVYLEVMQILKRPAAVMIRG